MKDNFYVVQKISEASEKIVLRLLEEGEEPGVRKVAERSGREKATGVAEKSEGHRA